jgi:hypothetical protein
MFPIVQSPLSLYQLLLTSVECRRSTQTRDTAKALNTRHLDFVRRERLILIYLGN